MLRGVLMASGLVLLVGCSGAQPVAYTDPTETPAGPGLFSGSSGEVTVTIGPNSEQTAPASE